MRRIAPGLYQSPTGFHVRVWVDGRRTWRKLRANKLRPAILEAARAEWQTPGGTFAQLAALYRQANCPNRRLQPRPGKFTESEKPRLDQLLRWFGHLPAADIRLFHLPKYHAWRLRHITQGIGHRTVDKELVTLSNVLNYAVATGKLELNYIRAGRPRFQDGTQIRHSRSVAPASADTVHALAEYFLRTLRSEVFAWQAFFAQFTGCRTSELLRLRLDAATPDDSGFVDGNMLFLGRRSKRGVNPFVLIGSEFAEMLRAFRCWHADRFPRNPHYFPSPAGSGPVDAGAFGHALTRACVALAVAHITPHGFRSYYVTKRRGDGASDVQIAGEIGDKTVSLMQTTYGDRPANWRGGRLLGWLPENALPAWQPWLPADAQAKTSVPVVLEKVFGEISVGGFLPQLIWKVVAGDGIEPPTQGFSVSFNSPPQSPLAANASNCGPNNSTTVRHHAPESVRGGIATGIADP